MEEILKQMICNGHWKIDINQAFLGNIDFQNLLADLPAVFF